MKFLFTQLVLLITSVIFLIYLFSLDYFLPYNFGNEVNWYNLSTVLILLFIFIQSFISLTIFLTQKFLAYSWSEFPNFKVAMKWGIIIATSFIGGFLLNVFSVLVFPWGSIALLLVIILLTVI